MTHAAPRRTHMPSSASLQNTAQRRPTGWSEDKARQYSKSERADFGVFVRRKGFDLK